jgi:hypothetical protein
MWNQYVIHLQFFHAKNDMAVSTITVEVEDECFLFIYYNFWSSVMVREIIHKNHRSSTN